MITNVELIKLVKIVIDIMKLDQTNGWHVLFANNMGNNVKICITQINQGTTIIYILCFFKSEFSSVIS